MVGEGLGEEVEGVGAKLGGASSCWGRGSQSRLAPEKNQNKEQHLSLLPPLWPRPQTVTPPPPVSTATLAVLLGP